MKKNILKILSTLALFLALAGTASAASITLSPSSINTTNGKTFDVVVTIDPKGEAIYTAKIELDFPANLVSASSFTFGNDWMVLSQSGYSLIDNTNGILIKSAGYPGGISSPIVLGTARFLAKANGNGPIKITANSLVYNSSNANTLSGTPASVSLVVSPVVVAPPANKPAQQNSAPKASTPTTTLPATSNEPVPVASEPEDSGDNLVTASESVEPTSTESSSLASIGNFFTLGTGSAWVGVITAAMLLLIIYFIVIGARKNMMKNKK